MVYKRGTPEYDKWRKSPEYDLWRERNSAAKKDKRNPNYGKHHSAETRAKMCNAWTPERRQTRSETQNGERNSFYGKHHSITTRAKMGEALIGERHPMYGKHHSVEARAKIRAAKIGKFRSKETREKHSKAISGEYNHNWLGGISFLPYPMGWHKRLRDAIRKRDNFTCALCGKIQTTRRHSIHHINYDKEDLRPENLVTLCIGCHLKTNHEREYWENLFMMVYVPDFPAMVEIS